MRSILALCVAVALAGCVTALSPAQRLYEAQSMYVVAKGVAVDYAESPTADPSIVAKLNRARLAAQPAERYARAFVLCRGKASVQVVAGVACALFDFTPGTLSQNAMALRNGAALLLQKETR